MQNRPIGRTRLPVSFAVLALLTMLSGCAGYYKVTDPGSGREYYTNSTMAGRYRYNGAVSFTDGKTGSDVVLQSSEVAPITKDAYYQAIGKPMPK